jgi:hypothetical protein
MPSTLHPPDRLDVRLEQTLRRATSGRLQGLSVQCLDDRMIVRGHAPSYYVKQLAIEAVKGMAAESRVPIVLDVVVAG